MTNIKKYLLGRIIWIGIIIYWFDNIILKKFPNLSLKESLFALWICIFITFLVDVIISYKRSGKDTIYNLMLAYGICLNVTYYSYLKDYISMIIIVTSIVTIIGLLLVFSSKIKTNVDRRNIIINRICSSLLTIKRNLGLAMMALIVLIGLEIGSTEVLMSRNVEVISHYGEQYSLDNNMDKIVLFQQERWRNLSQQERLDAIRAVVNSEAYKFGLSIDIKVGTEDLDGNILGVYKYLTHEIVIDSEYMKKGSAKKVLEAVCHECYHAYSYELCELYLTASARDRNLLIFDKTSKYIKEFGNYEEELNITEYFRQSCEVDAYSYAAEAVEDYCWCIEAYSKYTSE